MSYDNLSVEQLFAAADAIMADPIDNDEMVGKESAADEVTLEDLFAEADAIMANPIYQ